MRDTEPLEFIAQSVHVQQNCACVPTYLRQRARVHWNFVVIPFDSLAAATSAHSPAHDRDNDLPENTSYLL